MLPARIEGCTRTLGAPKGWTPETSGPCCGLPIRDEMNGDAPCMVSAWEPTPAEVAAIAAGAKVMLRVLGTGHPPVMLYVGDIPRDSDAAATAAETAKAGSGPLQDRQARAEGIATPKNPYNSETNNG